MSGAIQYLNGLGLVASGKRNIKAGKQYDKYFSAPIKSDPFLSYSGTTHDTIEFMSDIIKSTYSQTARIAQVIKKTSKEQTLKALFDFIFQHIQYKPDSPSTEQLRSPNRVWLDRFSGVDCDCYSIFIGTVLSNLKIPFALRMVKIHNKPYFQHVYVVVPKNGKKSSLESRNQYIVLDPVLDTFNEEHPFTEKYDLFMQPIQYLNGLNGLVGAATPQFGTIYHSDEVISANENFFFDGVDYYMRDTSMHGLNGLHGLGFLRKIASGALKLIKKAGSGIKTISKKGIKAIKYKKDDSGERTILRKDAREERREIRRAKRVSRDELQQPAPAPASPTQNDVLNTVQALDKSLGVDSILNLAKTSSPDTALLSELIDAKAASNKGISHDEARQIAEDTARAETAQMNMSMLSKAGFGGMNLPSLLIGGLLIGTAVYGLRTQKSKEVAA